MTALTRIKHKILLIVLGCLLSVVVLELGMRFVGWTIASVQGLQNRIAVSRDGSYKILCIGESTTFSGVIEHSYPAVLEAILNADDSDIEFTVINAGVIGTITENILFSLEENIERYSPDMIISMIGINDDRYDVLENRRSELSESFMERFLSKLKVVGLLRHIKLHAQVQTSRDESGIGDDFWNYDIEDIPQDQLLETAFDQMDAMNFTAAQNMFQEALKHHPNNADIYSALGGIWAHRGRHDRAMVEFEKALAIDPAHEETYSKMVDRFYYNRDYEQAEQTIQKMLKHVPDSQEAYEGLAQIYFKQKEYGKLEQVLNETREKFPHNYLLAKLRASYGLSKSQKDFSKVDFGRAEELGLRSIKPETISNYRQIRDVVIKDGIRLIAVQYPMRDVTILKRILGWDSRVVFVDNQMNFKQVVKERGYDHYFVDNFAGDFGHLTPMGNELLAQTIANAVRKSLY